MSDILLKNLTEEAPNINDILYVVRDPTGTPLDRKVTLALILAATPVAYERDQLWQQKGISIATDRYTLQTPNSMIVNVNNVGYYLAAQADLDLSAIGSWDTIDETNYTVAANRAGKDFFIYACTPASGIAPKLLISANSTVPSGYDADTSRKLGGFHCLCVAAGTISGHSLTGFVAGDILPASIWDLKWRPNCPSPAGMVYDSKSRLWVDIYLASGTGLSTASAFGGTISDTRNWMDFVDDGGAVGKRLLRDHEFQLAASGSNEETNIAGSADPVTTGGHSDTAGRRMISNIGCEDMCGVMWQWLIEQSYRYDLGTPTYGAASQTLTIYHAASPGGTPLYLKFTNDGTPYLCCNMAADTADKVITFGTNYKIVIKHDASAAVGSIQVYFDYDATLPFRLLFNNTIHGKDVYLLSNDVNFLLPVKHDASAATNGVAVNYDDGSDERLEYVSPGSANATLDLASSGPTWNWHNLAGDKGSFYQQAPYGDVKLLAGANWYYGTFSGSRARITLYYRWATYTTSGGRFAAEPE